MSAGTNPGSVSVVPSEHVNLKSSGSAGLRSAGTVE